MNPVVAQVCSRPENYAWSSYGWTAGPDPNLPWFSRKRVLDALDELHGPKATYAALVEQWPHGFEAGSSPDPAGSAPSWVASYRITAIRQSYARLREILLGAIGEHPRASSLAKEYVVAILLRTRIAEPIEIAQAFYHRTRFSIYNVFKRHRKARTDLPRYRWLLDLMDHEWPRIRDEFWGDVPVPATRAEVPAARGESLTVPPSPPLGSEPHVRLAE